MPSSHNSGVVDRHRVSWAQQAEARYPQRAPWSPSEAYPEYPWSDISSEENSVYSLVRECLRDLKLDQDNWGSKEWNPLGEIVRPGDRVFIKPNFVTHEYRKSCPCEGSLFSVITHPSVLRAVCDYVAIALKGKGEIVIGDNPCIDADFSELARLTQIDELKTFMVGNGQKMRVLDLRPKVTDDLRYYGFQSKTVGQPGDPEGQSIVDLGRHSFFEGIDPRHFRGVFTNRKETIDAHSGGKHLYSISSTILNSDVFISVPKLKAHHKVGATLNIKGLVGINYNKNFLIHWRQNFPEFGGDEYAKPHRKSDPWRLALRHRLRDMLPEQVYIPLREKLRGGRFDRFLSREVRGWHEKYRGSWQGNDTCWRMAADLYLAFIADCTQYRETQGLAPLRHFSIVDGIEAGEQNGPFCPVSKKAGTIVAGESLLAVDRTSLRLMDFSPTVVRYMDALMQRLDISDSDIAVFHEGKEQSDFFITKQPMLKFEAPTGWPELPLTH